MLKYVPCIFSFLLCVYNKLKIRYRFRVLKSSFSLLILLTQMSVFLTKYTYRKKTFLLRFHLVRVTVCSTLPCLSIIRSSNEEGLAESIENPGSLLQKTVPFTGFTLRLSEPAELVI